MEAFASVWYRLILLFTAAAVTTLWIRVGPGRPVCGVALVFSTFALGPALSVPVARRVPRHWYRVPKGERVLHRVLGVRWFEWLLTKSGWNRHVAEPMRGFSGKKAGLLALEESLRGNVSAHGTAFAIHLLLAVLALFSSTPVKAASWILLPGVAVHLYPVLLQRSILLRLQPLLDRIGQR